MATLRVYKETVLPVTLQPDSIYFITPAGSPDLVEIYVTNNAASAPQRHVINKTEIQAMIDTSIAAVNELVIVADIAARNALSPTKVMYVYVENATADSTVASGGATYIYKLSTTTWLKVSESESMDVVLNWTSIVGRPTSTVIQIDAAVTASHNHSNKTQLDLIGQNGAGQMTYNGAQVKTEWSSVSW